MATRQLAEDAETQRQIEKLQGQRAARAVITILFISFAICVALGGEDAFAVLEVQGADLAIVDFNTPGRNGLEIARELRSSFPRMSLAIVTANLQSEVLAGARAVRAYLVSRPVDEEGLGPFLDGTHNSAPRMIQCAPFDQLPADRGGQRSEALRRDLTV